MKKVKLRTATEEKGITLVALIITIIVLVILAAVSIRGFWESHFINVAINGSINYANAQVNEVGVSNELSNRLEEAVEYIKGTKHDEVVEPSEEPIHRLIICDATDKVNREQCNINSNSPESGKASSKWLDNYNECIFGTTSSANPVFCLMQPSDITGYNWLKAEIEVITDTGYSWSNLGLSVSNKEWKVIKRRMIYGNHPNAEVGKPLLNKRVTIELDISDITDKETYYGINGNTHKLKIYKMWLE